MIYCMKCGKKIRGIVVKAFDERDSLNKDCCSIDCAKSISPKYGILVNKPLADNLKDDDLEFSE